MSDDDDSKTGYQLDNDGTNQDVDEEDLSNFPNHLSDTASIDNLSDTASIDHPSYVGDHIPVNNDHLVDNGQSIVVI